MTAIGVVFGGSSPEHDISILTGLQAARILSDAGHDVTCVYWAPSGQWWQVPVDIEAAQFLEPRIKGATPLELAVPGGFIERKRLKDAPVSLEVIANCCHGGPGEDGSLGALLRLAGYRVTGPHPDAAALAMDKYATAAIAGHLGIPTIATRRADEAIDLETPWVVKPRFGGSSLGIETGVADIETVRALAGRGIGRSGTIVQPYLEGWVDLNVAVRSAPTPGLSAIERPLRDTTEILDYRTKYLRGQGGMESQPRELPAEIPSHIAEQIQHAALTLVSALALTGLPRIDFLWDGADQVMLCEVNSIPGALGLYLWEAIGIERARVLGDWIAEALAEPIMRPHWAATADGSALRVAGSIASKLAL